MCQIRKRQPDKQETAQYYLSEGDRLGIPKGGWMRNTSGQTIKLSCKHPSGTSEIHVLKPEEVLITKDEYAELAIIEAYSTDSSGKEISPS